LPSGKALPLAPGSPFDGSCWRSVLWPRPFVPAWALDAIASRDVGGTTVVVDCGIDLYNWIPLPTA
jgi:hypothetical protein